MFNFLFGKRDNSRQKEQILNEIFSKLTSEYDFDSIEKNKKEFIKDSVLKYGYLPYPHIKALEELSPEEVLYGLQFKWELNGIFKEGKFSFPDDKISVLARNNVKDADWIKKEGHDIKLINLAALGDGNKSNATGKFFDWLRQLLILPSGCLENNIFGTTIYLIPFHPREFGCAYLPKSSQVSEELFDKEVFELTGLDVKEQVKTFITLAQLAGHPVIYDVLPQTGRFSKAVIANPEIARWYDIKELNKHISQSVDIAAEKLSKDNDADDVQVIKDIYKQSSQNGGGNFSPHYNELYNKLENEINEIKKQLSNKMMLKSSQGKIHKRVRKIVADILGVKPDKKLKEDDITTQIKIIQELIKEELWPAPGGAWCSAGVPVYDRMSECGGYPTFKHYDYKGEDVTEFANLDCQTPYYFCFLENGELNEPVVKYFIDYMKALQKEYNFDGYRIDHIDHIVDKVSEADGKPISYRAPKEVLNRLNKTMKEQLPYFASLAEYMLWDDYLKEYHRSMNFDILWGNDIVCQSDKNPEKIIDDNAHLANYNINYKQGSMLSILKTYNNQDGEFRCIDQYPGQLGENGALYKWFKYKFLPGGKFAQRPIMYADGDESFTRGGLENVIGEEISLARENHEEFYKKFDAIDRFVKHESIINQGEAQIINFDGDGFAAWIISKEPMKKAFLIVSNYNYPTEKINTQDENGQSIKEIVEGKVVMNKKVQLSGDYKIISEFVFNENDFCPEKVENAELILNFDILEPGEFRIYELNKQ